MKKILYLLASAAILLSGRAIADIEKCPAEITCVTIPGGTDCNAPDADYRYPGSALKPNAAGNYSFQRVMAWEGKGVCVYRPKEGYGRDTPTLNTRFFATPDTNRTGSRWLKTSDTSFDCRSQNTTDCSFRPGK